MTLSPQKIDEIIDGMAKVGYELDVEGNNWSSLANKSIERAIWKKKAIEMLKSVKFPAYLYQTCEYLHNMGWKEK